MKYQRACRQRTSRDISYGEMKYHGTGRYFIDANEISNGISYESMKYQIQVGDSDDSGKHGRVGLQRMCRTCAQKQSIDISSQGMKYEIRGSVESAKGRPRVVRNDSGACGRQTRRHIRKPLTRGGDFIYKEQY